jgi:hypothetical protein
MNYWKECITEACEDAGLKVTDDQLDTITSWIEGAHENYGLATGSEFIPNPLAEEVRNLKKSCQESDERADKERENFRNNVATRRGVHPSDVHIDDQGQATYHY